MQTPNIGIRKELSVKLNDHYKHRATRLRAALDTRDIQITHSDELELIAQVEGYKNWNTFCAILDDRLSPIPKHWRAAGERVERFDYGTIPDPNDPQALVACIRLKSTADASNCFGTLLQSIDATDYVNKSVRFSAMLRTFKGGVGTIWMRADDRHGKQLAFDNLESDPNGPVHSETSWQPRTVTLDIPSGTVKIVYGFYLRDGGGAMCKTPTLEIIGPASQQEYAAHLETSFVAF